SCWAAACPTWTRSTSACPPSSPGVSSPTCSRRRWSAPCTAIPPAFAARHGCGRSNEGPLPRLLLDRGPGRPPLPVLRLAPDAGARGAAQPLHRPHGLRRLLRLGGEARPAGAARRAADRRR